MSNKDNLMASLMGEENGDADLFSAAATTTTEGAASPDDPAPFAADPPDIPTESGGSNENGGVTPAPPPSMSSSLLMQSGLLGQATSENSPSNGGGGGGGLFDEIDQEEERRLAEERRAKEEEHRRREEENRRRQQEEEQRRRVIEEEKRVREEQEQQRQEEHRMRQEEEAERRRQFAEENKRLMALQQQQMQDQMQSIHLGHAPMPAMYSSNSYGGPPQQMQQPYSQPQSYTNVQTPSHQEQSPLHSTAHSQFSSDRSSQQPSYGEAHSPAQHVTSFYREHPPAGQPPAATMTYHPSQPQQPFYQNAGAGMMAPQHQPPYEHQPQQNRYYQPAQRFSATAGMHHHDPRNNNSSSSPHALRGPPMSMTPPRPPPVVVPLYGKISVAEPLLIQAPRVFGMGQPPYWSYQVATQLKGSSGGVWLVRRRFRHVVALEDRLRQDCSGAILPPRPEKHATRAIEEASAQQSQEFAMQRVAELEVYLNQLVMHPYTHKSQVLRLFLSLQDDLGTAWPEVSSNALTRLASAGVGAAVKVSETNGKLPWNEQEYEDNAELLALMSSEQVRMGAVVQAVPKMEGAVTLMRELAEQKGAVGLELNRLSKEVEVTDRELGQPMEIVASGLLRAGRRSKRLALELSAAMHTFSQQYKLCRYEKLAMMDRKNAMLRRQKERGKADQRAAQLVMQQRQYYQQQQQYGYDPDRMERDAAMSDLMATDAVQECQEIGERLKQEINRVSYERRKEWSASVKVVASSMKEALSEQTAIWAQVRESFLQAFPEYD